MRWLHRLLFPGYDADLDRLERYRATWRAYDQWLSLEFPQIRRVLENLKAEAEGRALNAGTPAADENCTVQGLRTQLRRIEAG